MDLLSLKSLTPINAIYVCKTCEIEERLCIIKLEYDVKKLVIYNAPH